MYGKAFKNVILLTYNVISLKLGWTTPDCHTYKNQVARATVSFVMKNLNYKFLPLLTYSLIVVMQNYVLTTLICIKEVLC